MEKRRIQDNRNKLTKFTVNTIRRIQMISAAKAESMLPYDNEQFIYHIESQFVEGMSWENRGEWHIDHIKPFSWFLEQGITDLNKINALDNLRPLWKTDNLVKYNKMQ